MNASTRSRNSLVFSETSKITPSPLTTAGEPILAQHHRRRNHTESLPPVESVVVRGGTSANQPQKLQRCKPCNLLHQGTAETSPPSTCRETPVMYEAAGESMKAAALPSSAGSP